MNQRRFWLVVALLCLVAAACGDGAQPGGEEEAEGEGRPIELTVAANAVRGGKNDFTAQWMIATSSRPSSSR